MAKYQEFSFRSLDVGFDLRQTQTEINRPASIGSPNEYVVVIWDDGKHEGRACDCGSSLRKAGFLVSASWFAGRDDWGQPVVPVGQEDRDVFAKAGAMERGAWQWARANQGFGGDFDAWLALDDNTRAEYENGAAGIPT